MMTASQLQVTSKAFSSLCGGGRDLPEPCGAHGPLCRTYRYDNLGLYHRWAEQLYNVSTGLQLVSSCSAMHSTYRAERDQEARRLQFLSGAPAIPFAHSTSVQGNPMRSADFKSSSKYHKNCAKEI